MANRFPLVVDSINLNIKELPLGDNLDLAGSAVVNGAWQGNTISTTYTDAKVTSVNGQTGAATGFATTANSLAQFASTTSSQLATLISDETGSGSLVFATTPTLVTPVLGLATGTSVMLSANIGAAAGNVSGNFTAGNFQSTGNVNTASALFTGSITGGTLQTAGNVNANDLRVVTNSSVGTVISGTWQGTAIGTTYTDAKVTSVNGSTGAVAGLATTAGTLAQFGATTSLQLAGVISDETGSGALVFATSPTLVTPVLGTPSSGTLSNCTVDGTNEVGFKNVPQNSQSAAYTLVLADAGKHIFHPSTDANARTFTIPANSSVAYPIGTVIAFANMTSQVVTIAITTDTMYLGGQGTTGSRSLAQYGIANALKITSTAWVITGTGLT